MGRIFFPQYRRTRQGMEISEGKSILDYAREFGVSIDAECGGRGECGKCVVRIDPGGECLNQKTEVEREFRLGEEERLACQAKIVDTSQNITVFIKDFGKYAILSDATQRDVELSPFVYRRGSEVFYHSAEGKAERLDDFRGKIYGLAIDVGTTTLVVQLIDLQSGKTVATLARKNPQIPYGNDVISRIEYTMVHRKETRYTTSAERTQRLQTLQKAVIEVINESMKELEAERDERICQYVYDITIVGNPTMRNIFLGIDVSSLGVIPYEPERKEPVLCKAKQLGLGFNPQANVYGAPLIGGHAGADAIADIISTEIYKREKPSMTVDIGTNGEVIIGNRDRMLTISCAAGGAYEGATIKSGVGAIEGAIKNVSITDGKAEYQTIGNKSPVGICGSGLIDLLAELLRHGIMSKTAKLSGEFLVTDGINLSQQDVYQLITAKAGLRVDQDLLVKYYRTTLEQIDKIYLAGAFGNYINTDNAIAIGLLPDAPEKVVRVGNGALEGARQMLLSREKRKDAELILKKIEHIKPNEREKDFAYLVAERMYFTDPNS